jgi:hypothetical protein
VIHIVVLQRVPDRPMMSFVQAMKRASVATRKIMPSVWLVHTRIDAKELGRELQSYVTLEDNLLILRLDAKSDRSYGGLLSRNHWDWLQVRIETD